jgi:hypothetical protein
MGLAFDGELRMPILSALLMTAGGPNFKTDLAFLENNHVKIVVLHDASGAKVAVAPDWQNRVVTSSWDSSGLSMGFINYPLVSSGKVTPHIYPVGGEDRIWLGPEGGQFSLFFKGGDPFDLEHWQTPAFVDTEPFKVDSQSATSITCSRDAEVTNYSGFTLKVGINRTIDLVNKREIAKDLGVAVPKGIDAVAFKSVNRLTNRGDQAWTEQTGEPSIWILGMLKHSKSTVAIIPFKPGPVATMGPIVNDTYFGKVPANRLHVGKNALFFKCDGLMRTKIGVNGFRARNFVASFDAKRQLLTIMKFDRPNTTKYVNSMWEIQDHPFAGDLANSYNDGPPAPGKPPLGPFYEIEDSSPALGLDPGQTATHVSETFHFHGSLKVLRALAHKVLGVDISPAG